MLTTNCNPLQGRKVPIPICSSVNLIENRVKYLQSFTNHIYKSLRLDHI